MYIPDLSKITLPEKKQQASPEEAKEYRKAIKEKLHETGTVIIAHYYTNPEIQSLAEECGGFIGDSLEMARWGKNAPVKNILVAGVRFMGETASILSPDKHIYMPDLGAECSLDIGCPAAEFKKTKEANPDRAAVVYANTSAEVKACSDYVATSSCAVDLVNYLRLCGKKILWAPDRHLGAYVAEQTKADMLCWQAHCIVHDAFKLNAIKAVKEANPGALLMVHPESPMEVTKMADFAGSTSQILKKVKESSAKKFIIATDIGIFYKISQACPDKVLIPAPSGGHGATCESCAHCPWMGLNTLQEILNTLDSPDGHEIRVPESIRDKAIVPVQRMLDFNAALKKYGSPEAMVRAGIKI